MSLIISSCKRTILLRRQLIKLALNVFVHAKVHQVFLRHIVADVKRVKQRNRFIRFAFSEQGVQLLQD